MTTKTITRQMPKTEFKALLMQGIAEIINDPDFGLELSEKAKKRLKEAENYQGKNISATDIRKKYL